MDPTFDALLPRILKREGGFVDRKADRGGATNKGVTQAVYDAYRTGAGLAARSVRELADAEAAAIYREQYWVAARCGELPAELRDIHFDSAVNHGVRRAAILLQRAAGVEDDGVIGPQTLAAAAINPELTRARYVAARYRFYGAIIERDRSQLEFIVGWMARMGEFT